MRLLFMFTLYVGRPNWTYCNAEQLQSDNRLSRRSHQIWPLGRYSSERKQLIWNLKQTREHRWWFYVLAKFGKRWFDPLTSENHCVAEPKLKFKFIGFILPAVRRPSCQKYIGGRVLDWSWNIDLYISLISSVIFIGSQKVQNVWLQFSSPVA